MFSVLRLISNKLKWFANQEQNTSVYNSIPYWRNKQKKLNSMVCRLYSKIFQKLKYPCLLDYGIYKPQFDVRKSSQISFIILLSVLINRAPFESEQRKNTFWKLKKKRLFLSNQRDSKQIRETSFDRTQILYVVLSALFTTNILCFMRTCNTHCFALLCFILFSNDYLMFTFLCVCYRW